MPYKRFLGYQKGADGYPEIVEDEAQVVRRIFGMYLDGMTVQDIVGMLEREGIPAPAGGRGWHRSTVRSILGNEKYAGNAVLQKTYVEDFLTKKVRVNKGEIPKYYVENSHPAIIPEAVYRLACQEREKRQGLGAKFSGQYSLSSKVVCGECGGYYGRKVWHAGSKYAQTVWHCNNRFAERTYCGTPTVKEEMVQRAFVEMINAQMTDRAHVAQGLRQALRVALDMEKPRAEVVRYKEKCDRMIEELREMLHEAGRGQWTNKELEEKRMECIERHNAYKERLEQATAALEKQQKRADQIEVSLKEMEEHGLLTSFDAGLWNATVEKVVVESDTLLTFNLKDGRVVPWPFSPGVRTNRREGKAND